MNQDDFEVVAANNERQAAQIRDIFASSSSDSSFAAN